MIENELTPLVVEKLSIEDMCEVSFATRGTVTHSVCSVDGTDDSD